MLGVPECARLFYLESLKQGYLHRVTSSRKPTKSRSEDKSTLIQLLRASVN